MATVDLPVVTWTHAVTGQIHNLDVTGHPTMSAARGVGYEAATIPCYLTETERADIQGAVVHVHSTGWRGVVLARPEPNEPLLVSGYGKWAGSLSKRKVMYAKTDWMSDAEEDNSIPVGSQPSAFELSNPNATMTIAQSPGSVCNAGDHAGYMYWGDTPLNFLRFDCLIAHNDLRLRIYALLSPGVLGALVYEQDGAGTYTSQGAFFSDAYGFAVYGYVDVTPSAPSRMDKYVRIYNTKLFGDVVSPTIATPQITANILENNIPEPYYLTAAEYAPFTAQTDWDLGVLEFDSTTANEQFAELMRLAPIEYGWYSEDQAVIGNACVPHVFDRPTTAAYMLRLADCPSLPRLEQATLNELTSGTIVHYTDAAGRSATLTVPDTDPTHPLVALGIPRYGEIDAQAAAATKAAAIGALANAENGRARIKGDVTTDRLLTINGGPADTARVKAGEMCYVAELDITARIERVEWQGRYVTLTLDSAGYRLDAYLAALR